MTNAHMSRTAVLKALFALIVVSAIAWQIPFNAGAQSEGETLGAQAQAAATLNVSCSGSPNPADLNERVTWSSNVSGGTAPYTYSWTGNGSFSERAENGVNGPVVHTYYHAANQKNANVTVTSADGQTKTASCSINVAEAVGEPLSATCEARPDAVGVNEQMTWIARPAGGDGSYTYSWSGHSGAATTQSVTAAYANAGPKNASVAVSSNGQTVTAQCSLQVTATPPPPDCNAAADLVDASGNPFNPWDGSSIAQSGSNATVFVKNKSTACTYNVALATYKTDVYTGNDQAYINSQEFNDNHTTVLSPGETATLAASVPSCNWQADLFAYETGASAAPVPPDFAKLTSTHTLLDWKQDMDNGSCFPTGDDDDDDDECVPNPRVDLVDAATGIPFNPWDGSSINSNGSNATVSVRNRSAHCSYNVALASYATIRYVPGQEQHFIDTQTFFDNDVRTALAPGSTVTLNVPVPACNYQVDLFTFRDGADTSPVPPDFAVLQNAGTHTLLDWLVDADNDCEVPPQCPAQPTITSVAPSGTRQIGQTFSYTATTQGGTAPVTVTITAINPAPGLSINGNTVSGTFTTAGTFSYRVRATGADSIGGDCADEQVFTITVVQPPQCPAAPVFTSVPPTTAAIGTPFSYTAVTSGGVAPVTINITSANPAPGLSINGATVSGTPTTAGTYTYNITARSAGTNDPLCNVAQTLTITIPVVDVCPIPPTITSVPPVANNVNPGTAYSYTVTTSGGVAPVSVTIIPINAAPGLAISADGKTLSGTLTTSGTYSYRVSALSSGSPSNLDCDVEQVINISVKTIVDDCPASAIPTITSTPPRVNDVDTGTDYSYTVTTSGGEAPIIINIAAVNAAPGLSINGNTLSGEFEDEGNFSYTVTARSTGRPTSCAATQTITMSVDDGGGGGGGGGSSRKRRPNVVLFSEPEVAGASISLAQVPYTGLGTSLLQVFLFIIGLLAISAGIVYGVTRKLRRNAEHSLAYAAPAAPVAAREQYVDATPVVEPDFDPYAEYVYAAPQQAAPAYEPVAPVQVPRMMEPQFGTAPFKTATAPAPAALEHVSTPIASERPVQAAVAPAHGNEAQRSLEVKEIDPARIQNEARASRTLVSDDGAALIAHSAEGDEKRAMERLSQVIDIAKTRYPREDGWLILDKDRVRESLFISTLSMIPLFVEWIVRAEDKKVFTFLRMLKHQEQPVGDFMRKVVSELDTAHRARLEGVEEQQRANAHIAEVTYHLSNKELESIVAELLHGVDERYDSAYTSVRLSLVRVLDMVKERSLRAVGTPYAYAPEQEIV